MYTITSKRQVYHKLIALVTASFFFLNIFITDVLALAPGPGTQNPHVIQVFYDLNHKRDWEKTGKVTFKDPDFIRSINEGKDALALIVDNGNLIASTDIKDDAFKVMKAVIHEEVEAIMQIMAREDRTMYSTLINIILGAKVKRSAKGSKPKDLKDIWFEIFPDEDKSLSDELLANHIIAKAFELILTEEDRRILKREAYPAEYEFRKIIEPVIDSLKHSYFTGVFFDNSVREQKIRIAMANGMWFTQAASAKHGKPAPSQLNTGTGINLSAPGAVVYKSILFDRDEKEWQRVIEKERRWHEGIDFRALLADSRILVIGDTNHGFLGIQKGLAKRLPEFKQAGVTDLFLEMDSGSSVEDAHEVLERTWIPHRQQQIAATAKQLGIEIHFMDMPESFLKGKRLTEAEGRFVRGVYMGNYLRTFLRDHPEAKVVAITGYGHIADYQQIPRQLRDEDGGISTVFTGLVSEDQEERGPNRFPSFDMRLAIVKAVEAITRKTGNYGFIDTAALAGFEAPWVTTILMFDRPLPEAITAEPQKSLLGPVSKSLVLHGFAGLDVIRGGDLSEPAHQTYDGGVSDREGNLMLNERKILTFVTGLKGISGGQKFYLTTLLLAYARHSHPRGLGEGAIAYIGFVPEGQFFEFTLTTFGFIQRPDGPGAMPTHQVEVSLKTLQRNYGYADDLDVFSRLADVSVRNDLDKPESMLKMIPLIVAAKRHSGRMAIGFKNSAVRLWIYPKDVTGVKFDQRPEPNVELDISDFELTGLERQLFQMADELKWVWFVDLYTAIRYYLPDDLHDQNWTELCWALEETSEEAVNIAYGFGRKEGFQVPPMAQETVQEEILEARRNLRSINREQALKIFEAMKRRLAILKRANQLLDKFMAQYGDKIHVRDEANTASFESAFKERPVLDSFAPKLSELERRIRQEFPPMLLTAHESSAKGISFGGTVPISTEKTGVTRQLPAPASPGAVATKSQAVIFEPEIILPESASKEWTDFIDSLKALGKTASEEPHKRAVELDKKAAEYGKNGQSLILYADDILENVAVYDLQYTIKNILAKHNTLAGGKIILFARKAVNAKILEDMIRWAAPAINTVTITEDQVQSNGDEVKEVEAVTRLARAKGAKDILAIIRGPAKDQNNIKPFETFARSSKIPLVIVGPDKALYSLSQALSMAMDAKLSDGTRIPWLIMLPSIRTFTEDIRELHEQYKRTLESLRAA